ncbi:amidohydrolase family protein [Rhabdothermincola salaria]|uniref:amidohydrolase family protein n=1 Tax=Rhabdothermincola salaria TaxID=2903142 RepID=UPI001E36CE05|nr:amidohydrolase family protein [Rhabdothermincola salaria]MCD9624780.1 amidohydrolase family protein [Rhabdothermincola salaria]
MSAEPTVVDTLVNCFLPSRREVWQAAIADAGIPLKIVRSADDDFAEADAMVARMDALGIATLVLPVGDVGPHGRLSPTDFDHVATRWDELERLVDEHPGRFAGLHLVDPSSGMAGVAEARRRAGRDPSVVGFYLHTHSWDRPFDHADYYPWYALASDLDLPVAMQAGTSGGLMASACGQPIGIDRPALYFPGTRFVLSHTGWPWVPEAVAMALKFPNVHLGTGAYPPRHWDPAVLAFIDGPGRDKVLFATNFPTVGHHRALAQIAELGLDPATETALVGGTARRVFNRLPPVPSPPEEAP